MTIRFVVPNSSSKGSRSWWKMIFFVVAPVDDCFQMMKFHERLSRQHKVWVDFKISDQSQWYPRGYHGPEVCWKWLEDFDEKCCWLDFEGAQQYKCETESERKRRVGFHFQISWYKLYKSTNSKKCAKIKIVSNNNMMKGFLLNA